MKAENTIPISLDGKVQPQAVDLEEAVLGAIMLECEAYENVSDILTADMFYKPAHQSIYRAITDLVNEFKPIDLLTVTQQLRKNGHLEIAGGAYYVSQLTGRVATSANIEYHSRIIQQKFMSREFINLMIRHTNSAYNEENDIFDTLDTAEQEISLISQGISVDKIQTVNELLKNAIRHNQKILELKGGLSGISTGFRKLDDLTGGWQDGLIILAARPSMGKSALALDFLIAAALNNISVAMFSLEVSNEKIFSRIQSKISNIDLERITKVGLNDSEMRQMQLSMKCLENKTIYFQDMSFINIFGIKRKIKRLVKKNKVKMVIIDYLQLITGKENGNREQEISSITRTLKAVSKELSIPIIALSQLSREVEKTADKKPNLSHLRESGAIEQDADIVMFLYRPEYYGITVDDANNSLIGKAKIIVAKNREGALGDVNLDWIARITKFISEGINDLSQLNPNPDFFEEGKDIII